MTFRIGQKVVCIDDGPCFDGSPYPIKKGEIYTIKQIGDCSPSTSCIGFSFVERGLHLGIWMWCQTRFRPIVERKTDISVFTDLLNPSKQEKINAARHENRCVNG